MKNSVVIQCFPIKMKYVLESTRVSLPVQLTLQKATDILCLVYNPPAASR